VMKSLASILSYTQSTDDGAAFLLLGQGPLMRAG